MPYDRRVRPVAMGYSLSEVTVPQDLVFSQQSLEKLDLKAKFARHHITEDFQIKELLVRLPKRGGNAKINPQSDKVAYDKWIIDLNIATQIDRKLIEFLKVEAVQIFIKHKEARKALQRHLERLRELEAEKYQQQTAASEQERDELLERLHAALLELDNSVIKTLNDCLDQINFLNEKIGKLQQQKENIYTNLGKDVVNLFDKPECKLNGKNIFAIDKTLPPEVQKAKQLQLGQAFQDNIIPVHQKINQNKIAQQKIQLQRETSQKKLEMMQEGKGAGKGELLGVIKELVTTEGEAMSEEDKKAEKQKLVEEVKGFVKAKQAENEDIDQFENYVPALNVVPIGGSVYAPDSEELKELKGQQQNIDAELGDLDTIESEIERLEKAISAYQDDPHAVVDLSTIKTETERKKEEEKAEIEAIQKDWAGEKNVEYGPPTFTTHLRKMGYEGTEELSGNIGEKAQKIVENMVKKQILKEKKQKLKVKIEKFEEDAKKMEVLNNVGQNTDWIKMKDELVKKNKHKIEEITKMIKELNKESEALNREGEALSENFQENIVRAVSHLNDHDAELAVKAAKVKGSPEAAEAGAMAQIVREQLTKNPAFIHEAGVQLAACDAAIVQCAGQIADCQTLAANTVLQANAARSAMLSECGAAGAAMAASPSSATIAALSAQIQTKSTQDTVVRALRPLGG